MDPMGYGLLKLHSAVPVRRPTSRLDSDWESAPHSCRAFPCLASSWQIHGKSTENPRKIGTKNPLEVDWIFHHF